MDILVVWEGYQSAFPINPYSRNLEPDCYMDWERGSDIKFVHILFRVGGACLTIQEFTLELD